MTEHMVIMVGDADRWRISTGLEERQDAAGDGLVVRRTVDAARQRS